MSSAPQREALILAGGLGTRLQSVLPDSPKVLAEVAAKPFLFYLLDQLHDANVARVVLSTGHLAEQVEATVGNSYRGMEIAYSIEDRLLGTGGAIGYAQKMLSADNIFVMNGDSFCDVSLQAVFEAHLQHCADVTLVAWQAEDRKRFGSLQIDDTGRLISFDEKSAQGEGWINAGVYVIQKELLAGISKNYPVSLEHDVFPEWLAKNFYAYHASDVLFVDIGTQESLAAANEIFSTR